MNRSILIWLFVFISISGYCNAQIDINPNTTNTTNSTILNLACEEINITCDALRNHVTDAVRVANEGIGLGVWATLVDRNGNICCVVHSETSASQWPGSRVLSAEKAFTANEFSVKELAISTANMYQTAQGMFLGITQGLPLKHDIAYDGDTTLFGQGDQDPLYGKRIGGMIPYGGGLALYTCNNGITSIVGGLGIDGDTSCADHLIAWRVRNRAFADYVPAGPRNLGSVSSNGIPSTSIRSDDNIIYSSFSPFSHPRCTRTTNEVTLRDNLPSTRICT